MIETNIQHQQRDAVSTQPPFPGQKPELETNLAVTVTCALCDAVYAAPPLQLPFLRHASGALEAAYMSMCHFCFRCRRAACPQCWDEVHGVCGSCVQEAQLSFRIAPPPLDGLLFPPTPKQPPAQVQQASSLFVLVRRGRFYLDTKAQPDIVIDPVVQPVVEKAQPDLVTNPSIQSEITKARPDIVIDPADQSVIMQTVTPDTLTKVGENSNLPVAPLVKSPLPEFLEGGDKQEGDHKQKKAQRAAKKEKKASRLELTLTWIVLVILLVIVMVIALAEYIPAVNTLVVRLTHIDIHAEIAYLVHIVQQLFKK